jgi:hypothetical protein
MKRLFLILAIIVALAAGATWLATGANRGWTRTSIPVKIVDEVTGLEGVTYQKKFVPGIDFLGGAAACAAGLAGLSLLFRKTQINQNL